MIILKDHKPDYRLIRKLSIKQFSSNENKGKFKKILVNKCE